MPDHDAATCSTCETYDQWVAKGWDPFDPWKGLSVPQRRDWYWNGSRDQTKSMIVHVAAARGEPSPMRRLNAMREYSYIPPRPKR